MGSIDEEKKNAVRKLTREKDDLKQENEILKRKVQEFEKLGRGEQLSARSSVCFLIFKIDFLSNEGTIRSDSELLGCYFVLI
jgi:hypothetical protein